MVSRHGSVVDHGADADLAKMGYKSDLPRSLSMLSVLGLSFAIMAGVCQSSHRTCRKRLCETTTNTTTLAL
jgi:hypothetical protein